jgi:hypothetical protein
MIELQWGAIVTGLDMNFVSGICFLRLAPSLDLICYDRRRPTGPQSSDMETQAADHKGPEVS